METTRLLSKISRQEAESRPQRTNKDNENIVEDHCDTSCSEDSDDDVSRDVDKDYRPRPPSKHRTNPKKLPISMKKK